MIPKLPRKFAVALAIRTKRVGREHILLVQRPIDDQDFPGKWGLPATSFKDKDSLKNHARNSRSKKNNHGNSKN